MKRKMRGFVLLVLSAVIFGACAFIGTAHSAELTPLYTLPAGGTVYILGSGIVTVSNKYMTDTKFVHQACSGTLEIVRRMQGREKQKKPSFGIFASVDAYNAYKGKNEYNGKAYSTIRSVAFINGTEVYLAVRSNSGIKSYADIKGKRIGIGAAGSTVSNTALFLAEQHGITKKDFKPYFYSYKEVVEGIQDNSLDGGFLAGGFPIAAYTELANNCDVRIVPVDEKVLKKLAEFPYYYKAVVKAKAYKGVDKDIPVLGFTTAMYTDASVSDDMVYKVLKNLFDHKADYYGIHSSAKELTAATATKGVPVPLHPGAEKYLKSIGALK